MACSTSEETQDVRLPAKLNVKSREKYALVHEVMKTVDKITCHENDRFEKIQHARKSF